MTDTAFAVKTAGSAKATDESTASKLSIRASSSLMLTVVTRKAEADHPLKPANIPKCLG
jgi:hypothetical protein